MKKFILGTALSLFVAAPAFADFSIDEMKTLAGLAVDEFARENADHAQHLSGWKIWKSGEGAKVKIYVNHGGMNMEFNFDCHKHGDGRLQCHAQE